MQMVEDEDGQLEVQNVSHFSFPLDFQFLAQADKFDSNVSLHWPDCEETLSAATSQLG